MKFILSLAVFFSLSVAHAASLQLPDDGPEMQFTRMDFEGYELSLRVATLAPAHGTPKADLLYLHGFGDRFENHGPLFQSFANAGFRVITFDLPGHGESAGPGNDLDDLSFAVLRAIASRIEVATREDSARPLVLAGWSTGALLALGMAEDNQLYGRTLKGVVAFAPAIPASAVVGRLGIVTQGTLTSNPNPPHAGAPSPRVTFFTPWFGVQLLDEGKRVERAPYIAGIPTLVFTGGEDKYVQSERTLAWIARQHQAAGVDVTGVHCPSAYHEIDNEPGLVGPGTRTMAALFAAAAAAGRADEYKARIGAEPGGVCRRN